MKKLLFLLIFTVVSITLSIYTHAATIVTDGLVSYWTFDLHETKDGIAKDVWGENDAAIMGNPKIVDGHLRQGLKLHGTGDYVILDTLSNFQSRIGASSFEFWVKTSYDKRNTLFKVIEEFCGGGDRWVGKGWGMHLNASKQAPNFPNLPNIHQGGRNDSIIHKEGYILIEYVQNSEKICGYSAGGFPMPISDDKWHHIVYMFNWYIDESNEAKYEKVIFIDSIRKWSEVRGTPEIRGVPEIPEIPGIPGILRVKANPGKLVPFTQPVFLGAMNDNGKARSFFMASLTKSVFMIVCSQKKKSSRIISLVSVLVLNLPRSCQRFGVH